MNKELASIIFTVYNQGQYVRQSLLSALNQTYEPLEIIVSDDGSTDGTRQVIESVIAESGFCQQEEERISSLRKYTKGDKTIVVNFNEKNRGICSNFEYAFGLSHGQLVFTFGGDDISMPNRVETVMLHWVSSGKKAYVVTSGGWLMDVDGTVYREYRREVLDGAPVGAFNAYVRRVYEDFPRIEPALALQTYEDSVYGLRAQFFGPPLYVDELLIRYRFGSGVSTGGGVRRKMSRGAKAVKASCEQLLMDLASSKVCLPDEVVKEKRGEFIRRIEHETNLLRLLDGATFRERWHGYVACGYSRVSLKLRLFGVILLFPPWLSNLIFRVIKSAK